MPQPVIPAVLDPVDESTFAIEYPGPNKLSVHHSYRAAIRSPANVIAASIRRFGALDHPRSDRRAVPAFQAGWSDRPLGEGGMAVVWRARGERLHRHVAVKVLRSALVGHPAMVRRFEEEAQLTGQ